jgi:hypothetical protein
VPTKHARIVSLTEQHEVVELQESHEKTESVSY